MPSPVPSDVDTRRPSAAVYRRRRIVVFGVLALVVALLTTGGVYTAGALGAPVPPAQPAVTDPEPVSYTHLTLPTTERV